MSSFVISKEEYIKAAGVVAGLADYYRDFWVYDYKMRRNATTEDYYRLFCDCYKMNAISVAEQYGDEETECDTNEYMDVFRRYKKAVPHILMHGKGRCLLVELRHFFRSAMYQTENEVYNFKMEIFFGRIIDQLIDKSSQVDSKSWGSLEIDYLVNQH